MRKLLKSRRPCKSQSRSSKKTVAERQDEDTETGTSDAGTPSIGQDSKSRTPVSSVSSATKLKLAAFSAHDIGVGSFYMSLTALLPLMHLSVTNSTSLCV